MSYRIGDTSEASAERYFKLRAQNPSVQLIERMIRLSYNLAIAAKLHILRDVGNPIQNFPGGPGKKANAHIEKCYCWHVVDKHLRSRLNE